MDKITKRYLEIKNRRDKLIKDLNFHYIENRLRYDISDINIIGDKILEIGRLNLVIHELSFFCS